MSRDTIRAELRRAVLVESGHRCAIPRCSHTDIDVHHIVPWEVCKSHDYDNLIALCPNCHRRAHKGEIDRKSLREYKARLIADFSLSKLEPQKHPAIETKRRISAPPLSDVEGGFDFEYPDFPEPASRIISKNVEAWGEELLLEYESGLEGVTQENIWERRPLVWLRGRYHIARRDSFVMSLEYTIEQYPYGAAHRNTQTRVQNFIVSPFQPVTIENLLTPWDGLDRLSELVQADLFRQFPEIASDEIAKSGTSPVSSNFSLFTIGEYGLTFYFEEYAIACYAMGRLAAHVNFCQAKSAINPELYNLLTRHDGIGQ